MKNMKKTVKTKIYSAFLLCLAVVIPAQGMGSLYQNMAQSSYLYPNQGFATIGTSLFGSLGVYSAYNKLKSYRAKPFASQNEKMNIFKKLPQSNNSISANNVIPYEKEKQSNLSKAFNIGWDLNSLPLIPWYLKQFKALGRMKSLGLILAILPYGFYKAITKNKNNQQHMLYGKKSDQFYRAITLSSYAAWISKDVIPRLAKNRKYGAWHDVKAIAKTNKNSYIFGTMRGAAHAIFCISFLLEISRLAKRYFPETTPKANLDNLDMYI